MKTCMLLILLCIITNLLSDSMTIHKTDGSSLQFVIEDIIDFTFDIEDFEVIQIHKIDGTTDDMIILVIENIEFTESLPETMIINKIDSSVYEIETALITNITFGGLVSIDDSYGLIAPISFISNFPNPFNPYTTISFELNKSGITKIEILNIKGELVKTIIETTLSAGSHKIEWNGRDNEGNSTASGVYYCKISINGEQNFNKMLLLK